jgi:hypothetical protein
MSAFINLTGQRFGKLETISRAPNYKNKTRWNCICDCGEKTTVFSLNLKKGNTKSCGCLNTHHRFLDATLTAKHSLYYRYKKVCAKNRNYSFSLNFAEFIALTEQNCHYCGKKPNQFCKRKYDRKIFFYNGLDRLNNDRGYDSDNVVPCCKNCNRAKLGRSKKEFIIWLKKCYNHMKLIGLL